MTHYDHNHYFIELMHDLSPSLSSGEQVTARLERARDFIAETRQWLESHMLDREVSEMKVTALGRVMVTCSPEVMEELNRLDHPDVISVSLSSPTPPLNGLTRTA